jgi:dTDP-4-amino-4,6-dideoxygalactose transaminase
MGNPIFVTQPFLPPLAEFEESLRKIWETHWLTNNGPFHQQLERELCSHLGVDHISLFSNGTLALITALQALDIRGEVITTPYSFVATCHALWWNNIKPVFADIDPETFNLDPGKIEAAITSETSAILPVHVYGTPCDSDRIGEIAARHGLRVIYDACHAFGVTRNGATILTHGDLSVLSFHATKVFNTFEGGAIISKTAEMKKKIDFLKNFGFEDEVTVVTPGINAKMNEVQAAFGLLQLKYVEELIEKRKRITGLYRELLEGTDGISCMTLQPGVKLNYSYFPILVDEERYGLTRDRLYELLKEHQVFGRRYFYPLISRMTTYAHLKSADPSNLPVAERVAAQVICLPIYPDLPQETVHEISRIIRDRK